MKEDRSLWFGIGWGANLITLTAWTVYVHPPLFTWWCKLSALQVEILILQFLKLFD